MSGAPEAKPNLEWNRFANLLYCPPKPTETESERFGDAFGLANYCVSFFNLL